MGVVHDGARSNRGLLLALLTLTHTTAINGVVFAAPTSGADKSVREPLLIQELLAALLCGEALLKLFEGDFLCPCHTDWLSVSSNAVILAHYVSVYSDFRCFMAVAD